MWCGIELWTRYVDLVGNVWPIYYKVRQMCALFLDKCGLKWWLSLVMLHESVRCWMIIKNVRHYLSWIKGYWINLQVLKCYNLDLFGSCCCRYLMNCELLLQIFYLLVIEFILSLMIIMIIEPLNLDKNVWFI